MLNEDKVILMTRLASYEAGEGKRSAAIGSFFRSDYIGWQVLKSAICGTIAFMIVVALGLACSFEDIMVEIYKMDILEYAKTLLSRYLIFIAVLCVITYGVYIYRYNRARKSLKRYYSNLRRLSKYYED